MRNYILSSVLMVLSTLLFAQAPSKMSYQAVIRNNSDQLVTNHAVGMRVTILQGSATGTVVYTETQTPTTNANGLVSIEIGGGVGFDVINWANHTFFIKTETDPTGGTSYTITGTSQLLSVPYALQAKTAATADYNTLTNLPALNISNWNTAYGWGNHSGLYRPLSWVPAWTDVTGKPTTINGFGIIDAVTLTGNQSISGIKTFNSNILVNGIPIGKKGGGIAVGINALRDATSNHDNIAIGSQSLMKTTEGWGNTAIGSFTLNENQTGDANTAVGYQSLYSNLKGGGNTAIGQVSGFNNVGDLNVFIGTTAGYWETGSNKLFIDSHYRANELDARAKSLIYGVFDDNPANQILALNGNVGIGTINPQRLLHIKGNGPIMRLEGTDHCYIDWYPDGAASRKGYFGYPDASVNDIYISNEITLGDIILLPGSGSSGNVGVGTFTPNYKLDVRGTIGNNTTLYHSDIRWKTDIRPIKYGINELLRLNSICYLWDADDYPEMGFDKEPQFGFIAQEFEKVIPELVKTDKEGYKSIDYVKLTPVLVEAIKEQQKQIDELKALVNKLISNQTVHENN